MINRHNEQYEQAPPDRVSDPSAWGVPELYNLDSTGMAGWWRVPKLPYLNHGQDGKLLTNNHLAVL